MNFSAARIIAFDNDGTVYPAGVEVGQAMLEAHRRYVAAHGLSIPTPSQEWVTNMIGSDAKEFYAAMLPNEPLAMQREFEEFCLDMEHEAVLRHPYLFPGAEELFSALRAAGRTLLLVTNGSPRYVESVWQVTGLGRYFAKSYPYAPPEYTTKGERLAQAVREHGRAPAVMIGDRASDLEAAREAGLPFIGAAYGYARDGELAGADAVVSSVRELYNLLLAPEERKR